MTLEERLEAVRTREDLSQFVEFLAQDLRDHPGEWENSDLGRYLDALSGLIDGLRGLYRNVYKTDVPEQPSWKMIGMMLLAAKIYE